MGNNTKISYLLSNHKCEIKPLLRDWLLKVGHFLQKKTTNNYWVHFLFSRKLIYGLEYLGHHNIPKCFGNLSCRNGEYSNIYPVLDQWNLYPILNNTIGQQTWVEPGITKTHWSDSKNWFDNFWPRYSARNNWYKCISFSCRVGSHWFCTRFCSEGCGIKLNCRFYDPAA